MSDSLPPVPNADAPREPLVKVGGIVGLLTAFFAVLVSFGFKMSDDQQSALLGFAAIVAPIVVALWGRLVVFAPHTVRRMVNRAGAQKSQVLPTTGNTEVRDVS